MTLAQILEAVVTDMTAWVATLSGTKATVSAATDPWNVLEILVQSPRGLQVICAFAGREAISDQPREALGLVGIDVTVGMSLGLEIPLDQALYKAKTNRPALLAFVDAAGKRLLSMHFPEDETGQYLEDAGVAPVTLPSGIPLAAYRVSAKLRMVPEYEETYRAAVYTA